MKNLANCTPVEFLVQTNKIRKYVQNWLTVTEILEIRKHMPDIPDDAEIDVRKAALAEQSKKNLSDIFDACAEKHPEETAVLIGLLCFIEPEEINNYKMSELIGSFNELLSCKEVVSFFTSLMRLVLKNTTNIQQG